MRDTKLKLLALLAVMSAAGPFARAGTLGFGTAEPPFEVGISVPEGAVRRGEVFEAEVLLRVRPGNYLYREMLKLSLAGSDGLELVRVEIPKGEVKRTIGPDGNEGDIEVYKHDTRVRVRLRVLRAFEKKEAAATLRVAFQGCAEAGYCHAPGEKDLPLRVAVDLAAPPVMEAAEPSAKAEAAGEKPGNWLFAILVALGAGLAICWTPCVYPIIPITAAVVTSQARGKSWVAHLAAALLFVLGLSIVYALLGLVAGNMGVVLQYRVTTIFMVAVLFLLAASLFGAYDLKLPDSVTNRLRTSAKVTGPASLVVFGAVSGLVAGPCVSAPLIAVLAAASQQAPVTAFFMLFAFAWGMSALLIAVGTFPGLFSKLPKAGVWMSVVKTVGGVVILAVALYFAKTLVPSGAFTVGALAVAAGLGFGFLVWTFVHHPRARLAHFRETAAAALLLFAAYQGAGVAYARGADVPFAALLLPASMIEARAEWEHREQVSWVTDETAALEKARAEGKPLLVDFYADWCVYCKALERTLFGDAEIVREINKRFVALRVDGTKATGETRRLEAKYGGKYPTIVVLDAEGNEAARFAGEAKPDTFLEKLRAVR